MRWFLFLFLILFSLITVAQKTPDYIYEFNKYGELVKGPPSILKQDDCINIRIPLDTIQYNNQFDSLLSLVLQARIYWNRYGGPLNSGTEDKWKDKIEALKIDLNLFYDSLLYYRGLSYLYKKPDTPAGPPEKWPGFTYTPKPFEIVRKLKEQYVLRIDCVNPDCKKFFTPYPVQDQCEWIYQIPQGFQSPKDLEIYLYRTDPLKQIIKEWYNKNIEHFPYLEIGVFENSVQNESVLFNKIKSIIKAGDISSDSCTDDKLKSLNDLSGNLDTSNIKKGFDYFRTGIDGMITWMLSFAWLNKSGSLQMNPFPFTSPGLFRNLNQKSTVTDKTDSSMMAILESLFKKEDINITNFRDYYALAWYKRDSAKSKIDSVKLNAGKQSQSDGSQAAKSNADAFAAFAQTTTLLNIVKTPVSSEKQILHIRNYYYNRRPDKRDFKYDYADDDQVVLAIHNKPFDRGTMVLDQKSAYVEQPVITSQALDNLSAAGTLPAITNPTPPNKMDVQTFAYISGIGNTCPVCPTVKNPPAVTDCAKKYNSKLAELRNKFQLYQFWDSLSNISQVPPMALENVYNDSALMSTDLIFPDGSYKPPYQYLYKLTIKDTSKSLSLINPLDSSGYRVGKRRIFELALGAAYSFTSVRQTNIASDSSGNLMPSTTEQKVQFVVGLKYHFLKGIYWENTEFLAGKALCDGTLKERVFIFLGVSIPNPLNNIYTGLGVDLVPGLNINAGAQWYQYTQYQVNNNTIIKQTTQFRPAFYGAVTFDPVLIVNIVKTFFN